MILSPNSEFKEKLKHLLGNPERFSYGPTMYGFDPEGYRLDGRTECYYCLKCGLGITRELATLCDGDFLSEHAQVHINDR